MYKVYMHAGALGKVLYGCAYVRHEGKKDCLVIKNDLYSMALVHFGHERFGIQQRMRILSVP